ncbi:unnamed protein product [Pichia kudriavzevii]
MTTKIKEIKDILEEQFGIENFDSLNALIEDAAHYKAEELTDEKLLVLVENTLAINASLEKLQSAMKIVSKVGSLNDHDPNWIISGRVELNKIFHCIDSLEFNIDKFLNQLARLPTEKLDTLLDILTKICNQSLSLKKIIHTYRERVGILSLYNEIQTEVLTSVHNEILYCQEQLDLIIEKNKLLKIEKHIESYTLEDFKKDKKNIEMFQDSGKYSGFIIFTTMDSQIFEVYSNLYESILPISQSLNLIPQSLEQFYSSCKRHYKSLVSDTIAKYESILSRYNTYRKDLKSFKDDYIVSRNDAICKKVFDLVNVDQNHPPSVLQDVLDIIKPIEHFYGVSDTSKAKLRIIEKTLASAEQDENMSQTAIMKTKTPKPRRTFSNPLADSLNMKPILSNNVQKKNDEVKIFQTPKSIDDSVFSKENRQIIQRMKMGIQLSTDDGGVTTHTSTPSSVDSFGSSSSSPDVMKTKNIFDSPDPFITPNSRSFNRFKMPLSTPSSTPRISPTKKYVMLPTDDEPQSRRLSSFNMRPLSNFSLLQFDQSTVVNIRASSDNDESDTSITSIHSDDLMETPGKSFPSNIDMSVSSTSPDLLTSRIPLPKRPESRMVLIRSASRMQTRVGIRQPIQPKRPDSRLENIASSISSKLGTDSPTSVHSSLSSGMYSRPTSVMTQREMIPRERPIQLGRLRQPGQPSLHMLKARGATSLGSRSSHIPKSRITSI